MIKKTALAALFAFAISPLHAAAPSLQSLQAYAAKALAKCPDGKIELRPINEPGPTGFIVFERTATSSDTTCGRHTLLLFSPASNQVLIGSILSLPFDNRTTEARIADTASAILNFFLMTRPPPFPPPFPNHALSM